jgi:hypothetical protein
MDSGILTACCWLLVFLQIVFAVPMGVKVSRDENRLDDGMALVQKGLLLIRMYRRKSVWTWSQCAGYEDTRQNRRSSIWIP